MWSGPAFYRNLKRNFLTEKVKIVWSWFQSGSEDFWSNVAAADDDDDVENDDDDDDADIGSDVDDAVIRKDVFDFDLCPWPGGGNYCKRLMIYYYNKLYNFSDSSKQQRGWEF